MKQFVILQVEEVPSNACDGGIKKYQPVDVDPNAYGTREECLYLYPSRIIDGDRLRYGRPFNAKVGSMFFTGDTQSWMRCGGALGTTNDVAQLSEVRLILDPPPSPKSDWETWAEQCPACTPNITAWLKRMPKRD